MRRRGGLIRHDKSSSCVDGRHMISARSAAKIARCTQDYIIRLARQGKIRASDQAGHLCIDEAELRKFLLERARRKEELRRRLREERRTIHRLHDERGA